MDTDLQTLLPKWRHITLHGHMSFPPTLLDDKTNARVVNETFSIHISHIYRNTKPHNRRLHTRGKYSITFMSLICIHKHVLVHWTG